MYLIVGLGNPEEEYSNTRHNMGFATINKLAKKLNIEVNKKKFNALYGSGIVNGQKIILIKPQTYMNLSGESVADICNYYNIDLENLIVIYDDIDLDVGKIRIRKKGSGGTHNGMKSVVSNLQTEDFPRIRIGIGEPTYKNDLLNFILTKIPNEEYKVLEKATENAANAIVDIISNGIDTAMNKYN